MKWYRHVYIERQVASDPGDLMFLNNNQAVESQIVKLSFEFAKAGVALAKTAAPPHDAPRDTGSFHAGGHIVVPKQRQGMCSR